MSVIESNYEKYIFDNAKVGIAICNADDNRLEAVNYAFANIHGYKPHDLIGATTDVVFAPESILRFAKHENSASSCTTDDVSFETTHIKKDGSLVYVSVHVTVIKDENGAVKQRIANVIDISGRKQIEKELKKREREYHYLIESLPDSVVRYDNKCRRVYVNKAWERVNRLKKEDVIGKSPVELSGVVSPKAHEFEKKLKAVMSSAKPDEWEISCVDVDKKHITFSLHGVPEYDDNGDICGVLTIARDITQRKFEEEKKLDEQMRFFFEKQLVGMAIISPQKGWLSVNDKLCNMLGYIQEEFQSFTWAEITHPDDLTVDIEQFERLLQGKIDRYTLKKRFIHKNGTIVFTNTVVSCVRSSDKTVDYVLSLIEDITNRVCAEEALHELNNTLEKRVEFRTIELKKTVQKLDAEIIRRKSKEEKLYKSEDKLRALADNIPGFAYIYCLSPDGNEKFIYASKGIIDVYGITAEDAVDDISKVRKIFYPDDIKEFRKAIFHSSQTITPFHAEFRVINPNKGKRWLETRSMPEVKSDGSVIWHGVTLDVTERKRMEERLEKREEEFRSLAENAHDPIYRYDRECRRIYVNQAVTKLTGKTSKELLGKKSTEVRLVSMQESKKVVDSVQKVLQTGKNHEIEVLFTLPDGTQRYYLHNHIPEFGEGGEVESVLAIGRDITAQKELATREEMFRTLAENSPNIIMRYDKSCNLIYVNPAFERQTGISKEKLLNVKPNEQRGVYFDMLNMNAFEYQDKIKKVIKSGESDSFLVEWITIATGRYIAHNLHIVAERDKNGRVIAALAIGHDVTEIKNIEKRIEFMAHHDALTGLPNRILIKDRAEQALANSKRLDKKTAVLFIDLDEFKTINDSLGHSTGDAMLKLVSTRLQKTIRASDTLSREGGDEFLLLLPNINNVSDVGKIADNLLKEFQTHFSVNNQVISISASIGIAIYPEHGENFEQLLQSADAAMYRAKEIGKNNYCFFTQQMKHNLVGLFQMQNDLKNAIKNKEFVLHYQPQIDLAKNKITGAEALIRWKHAKHGMISPMNFISVAESTGLIVEIGAWVIMEACKQAAHWNKEGKEIVVAVNISAVQFQRSNLEDVVKNALKITGLDPKYLELELTESILISDTENILQTVKVIKDLGIQLSIDDFGTGYSSLAYLKRFAVDKLKIDQSFVKDVLKDKEDASIVKTIVQMAKSFNLKSIAEGVENAEVLAAINEFGCDEVQGYHFAKPMEAKEFENYYMYEF